MKELDIQWNAQYLPSASSSSHCWQTHWREKKSIACVEYAIIYMKIYKC